MAWDLKNLVKLWNDGWVMIKIYEQLYLLSNSLERYSYFFLFGSIDINYEGKGFSIIKY